MKASPTPGNYLTVILLGTLLAGGQLLRAQDSVTLQNGQRREGKITGVSGGNIQLQIATPDGKGSVTSTVPLAQAKSAVVTPPAEYTSALAAWQDGNTANFLSTAKPLVDKFRGLPSTWVASLSALLPAAYVLQNNLPEAEKSLADFSTSYPNAKVPITIGKARIALAKKDTATAKTLLQPISAEAAQTKLADSSQSATFGQAFYLLGQVYEAEGNLPEALNSYLKTTTLFYEDKATTNLAQQKADALTKTSKVVVP